MKEKNLHIVIICFTIVLCMFFQTQQAKAQRNVQIGINGIVGFPQNQFKDHVNNNNYGANLEFLFSPSHNYIGVGISGEYLQYGSEKHSETIQTSVADFEADLSTTNFMAMGHILVRAQRKDRLFKPYLDLLVGFNYIATTSSLEGDGGESDISTKHLSDYSLSYGTGFGFMFKVYGNKGKKNETETDKFAVFMDFRMRYLIGNKVEYLKKGGIQRINGELVYDVLRSETDLLKTQLGLVLEF